MKLAKQFELSTGHRLSKYSGKCRHLHGHNYIGELVIEGEQLNELGMLMDFADMKQLIKTYIDEPWDHKFLLKRGDLFNEALGEVSEQYEKEDTSFVFVDYNPTVENMIVDLQAKVQAQVPNLKVSITLKETSTSLAVTG